MRKSGRLIWIGLLGLALLAVLAAYLFFDAYRLKPVLTAALSKSLRRQVSVEKIAIQIFPPGLNATNLSVADDPAFSNAPFLKAASIEVRPSLPPLLTGNLEITSIRINATEVELIQNEQGIWNFSTLGSNEPNRSATRLARLGVEKASIGILRPQTSRQVYSNLSAEVRDYADGEPFQLRLAALMPSGKSIAAEGTITAGKLKTSFKDMKLSLADLKASLEGDLADTAMNLRLAIPKSNIQTLAPLFLPAGTATKGEIEASIEAQGTIKAPRLQGRVDITGFEVSGGEIKQPVRTAKLGMAITPDRISIEPATVVSGSTQLLAFAVLSQYASKPMLEATLLAPTAKLPELLAIAQAYGVSAVDGANAEGDAKLQIRIHGALGGKAPLAYAGSGSLASATVKLPSFAKPVEIANANFRFDAEQLAANSISARLGSSDINGEVRMSNLNQPTIGFDLTSSHLHLDELRSIIKSEPGSKPSNLSASEC